jgi:hypothetical protein
MLAWRGKDVGKYQCFLSWFILPMFTALIVASFILAAFIGIGASANAGKKVNVYFICCLMDAMLTELIAGCCLFSLVCIDFCSGGEIYSPDGTFNEILKLNGYSEDDSVYRIFTFYVDVSAVGPVIIVYLVYALLIVYWTDTSFVSLYISKTLRNARKAIN